MRILKPLMISLIAAGFTPMATAESLNQELGALLEDHPLIRSAHHSVQSAEQGVKAGESGYLPKINLRGDGGWEKVEAATDTELDRRSLSLTVEQSLYAGGKIDSSLAVAQSDLQLQQVLLENTVQTTLFSAISAYLQVVRYQKLIAIARRNEETTQTQLQLEDERVQRGGGIAVDVLQAKTRLQITKERRVVLEQSLRNAVATYQQIFNHAPPLERMEEIVPPTQQLPESLEAALTLAQQHQPSLKESQLQLQKAEQQRALIRSGFYPAVDLVGKYGLERDVSQVQARDEQSLLLRLNWNLYSGHETVARSEAALLSQQALQERDRYTQRKVTEAVETAWNQYHNGLDRQELLQNASNISYEVMQHRKRLRDSGKETAINVLDAELEYYTVMSNLTNALYDTHLALYQLLQAMGQLEAPHS